MDDERVGSGYRPADRAAATAWAGTERAMFVGIPTEAELEKPVFVRLSGTGAGRGNGHTVIEAGRHSRGTVVLQHSGTAQHNAGVEIRVGDGADLTVVSLQEWDDDAIHLAQHDAVIGRDARLRHIVGHPRRRDRAAQHQRALLRARRLLRGARRLLRRRGAAPGAPAVRRPRGAALPVERRVQGRPAGRQRPHRLGRRRPDPRRAEGTDTYELNRNLVLTDGARADSVPNLEIETGEIVGAGHASATGRFDDEQLFYLQSRGIHEVTARRLVVRGFFASVIARIGVPELQEHLMAAIDAELEGIEVPHDGREHRRAGDHATRTSCASAGSTSCPRWASPPPT